MSMLRKYHVLSLLVFIKRPPSAFVFSFCISMPWITRKKTIKLSHVFKVYPITYLNICMQNINSNLCEKWMHTQGSYNPKVFTCSKKTDIKRFVAIESSKTEFLKTDVPSILFCIINQFIVYHISIIKTFAAAFPDLCIQTLLLII